MMDRFNMFVQTLSAKDGDILCRQRNKLFAGKFGNCKRVRSCNDGNVGNIREAVVDIGPGYRIYYTVGCSGVSILGAGTKKNQRRDIRSIRDAMRGRHRGV